MRRYSPKVFRIAGKFFRQPAAVEDAAQEAFLKAYTQLSSFEGRGSFEGWLSRITANQCINMLRHARRRPESAVAELTDHEGPWLENQLGDLSAERHAASERGRVAADIADKVLSGLSPEDRLVLLSIDGDQLSVKDVAVMTGWSESKVKVRAFRARRRMREAVENLLERSKNPVGEKGKNDG